LDHLYNFLGTLNEECEEEAEPYDSFEATLRSNESCYKQFAKQVCINVFCSYLRQNLQS